MAPDEFNEKWKAYLKENAFGLQIDNNRVVEYLDKEFSKETNTNSVFIFGQIKIKFGTSRIYPKSYKTTEWEQTIDQILME